MSHSRSLKTISIIGLSLALAACGSLVDLGSDAPPNDIYRLSAGVPAEQNITAIAVAVEPPTMPRGLAGKAVAVSHPDGRVEYLGGAEWEDRAPAILGRLLVESLENTGTFNVVGANMGGVSPRYRLVVDVRDFSYQTAAGRANLVASGDVIDTTTGDVIARQTFSLSETAAVNDTAAIMRAMQDVASAFASRFVTFATAATE